MNQQTLANGYGSSSIQTRNFGYRQTILMSSVLVVTIITTRGALGNPGHDHNWVGRYQFVTIIIPVLIALGTPPIALSKGGGSRRISFQTRNGGWAGQFGSSSSSACRSRQCLVRIIWRRLVVVVAFRRRILIIIGIVIILQGCRFHKITLCIVIPFNIDKITIHIPTNQYPNTLIIEYFAIFHDQCGFEWYLEVTTLALFGCLDGCMWISFVFCLVIISSS
mmetsp:Transcript_8503/g.20467  ORF Transcript_8503/g.20467 Transcript_8503/m.20467 type:complete len:222 (+) Transcript_8503:439-1104(+)